MSNRPQRGRLIIVSAPSGAGKTTVVDQVLASTPGVDRSRSFTSRAPRPGELDGVDYNFVPRARFEAMVAGSLFLEWAEIVGHLYGTGVGETERALAAGVDLILVIDVQGARLVRQRGLDPLSIFLMPPSASALEARLRGRKQNAEDDIQRRLMAARTEIHIFEEYDYVVFNDDLAQCVQEVRTIVLADRARVARRREAAVAIASTFDRLGGMGGGKKGV
jgi:guanylate kinase